MGKCELVSIIVPVYNTEEYLSECLDSLLKQTYKNIEVICIDDGSVDGSVIVLKEYERLDNRVRVYTQDNKGVSYARNVGLDNAQGKYIFFIDSDDYIKSNTIEECIHIIKTECVEAVFYNNYMFLPDGTGHIGMQGPLYDNLKNRIDVETNQMCPLFLNVSIGCFDRKIIEENNLRFRHDKIYEDWDFVQHFISLCTSIYWYKEPLYFYRWGIPNTISSIVDKRCLNMFETFNLVKEYYIQRGIWNNVWYTHIVRCILHAMGFIKGKMVTASVDMRKEYLSEFSRFLNQMNEICFYSILGQFSVYDIEIIELIYNQKLGEAYRMLYIPRKKTVKERMLKIARTVFPTYRILCQNREMLRQLEGKVDYLSTKIERSAD